MGSPKRVDEKATMEPKEEEEIMGDEAKETDMDVNTRSIDSPTRFNPDVEWKNFRMGSLVTYAWIFILHKQKMSVRLLREKVRKDFGIEVSMSLCRRAKKYALSLIEGTIVDHYAKLWSYGEDIRRSNPGSTMKMQVNSMPDGKNYFSKFYVCFAGLREGWRTGCRIIINLDGCFLKGLCIGELLSAVGRDGNNKIFPIAWVVVCVENK